MVKVNLLSPESARVKKTISLGFNFHKASVILFSLGIVFLLVGIYLIIETAYRKQSLIRLIEEYTAKQELKKKIEVLKLELDKSEGESNILKNYLQRSITWSKKLSQLRDLIPGEVWLKQLSFEKKSMGGSYFNNLSLKGSLIPKDRNSPIGTLSMFVNKLKQDAMFFIDFENLVLSDFRKETYKNAEVMTFSIEMPLKPR